MFSNPDNLFSCCSGETTHKHTEQIHSNEALCIGKPGLEVQFMNMHLEINDSIVKHAPQTLNSKFLASAAAASSCFQSVTWRFVCALAVPSRAGKLPLSPTARAGVPHLAYRGGFGPASVKLDWKLHSERGLVAAGIRKFPCEKEESRRGECVLHHLRGAASVPRAVEAR